MPSKMWDEITDPFPNFNIIVEVWEWISYFIPNFIWCYYLRDDISDYLSITGLKLIHVNESGLMGLIGRLDYPVTMQWYLITADDSLHGVFI